LGSRILLLVGKWQFLVGRLLRILLLLLLSRFGDILETILKLLEKVLGSRRSRGRGHNNQQTECKSNDPNHDGLRSQEKLLHARRNTPMIVAFLTCEATAKD
jgi:hypothetical protein